MKQKWDKFNISQQSLLESEKKVGISIIHPKITIFRPVMARQEQWIQGFRAGDVLAFKQVMELHVKALTFHIYSLCRNREVSEDIASETFAKLWKARDNFESELHIKSFLYRVGRNASIDYLGSLKRRTAAQQMELDEALVSKDTDPLTHMIHAEFIERLIQEIDRLPKQQAAVFRMTYLEDKTTDEICAHLGVSPNAVFLARKKATAALRKTFSGKDLFLFLTFLDTVFAVS